MSLDVKSRRDFVQRSNVTIVGRPGGSHLLLVQATVIYGTREREDVHVCESDRSWCALIVALDGRRRSC
jgi:hypothetical protein